MRIRVALYHVRDRLDYVDDSTAPRTWSCDSRFNSICTAYLVVRQSVHLFCTPNRVVRALIVADPRRKSSAPLARAGYPDS
jgi:hypothetical protein